MNNCRYLQENCVEVRIEYSQWFDTTFYTSVFKLPPGGGPSLQVVYGLIGTKGLCIGFIRTVRTLVWQPVDLFVASATHKFAPNLLELLQVGLISNKRTVLGSKDCGIVTSCFSGGG